MQLQMLDGGAIKVRQSRILELTALANVENMFTDISPCHDDCRNGQSNERFAHPSALSANHLYLPQVFKSLTFSMGYRVNVNCIPLQSRFRKDLPPPTMG